MNSRCIPIVRAKAPRPSNDVASRGRGARMATGLPWWGGGGREGQRARSSSLLQDATRPDSSPACGSWDSSDSGHEPPHAPRVGSELFAMVAEEMRLFDCAHVEFEPDEDDAQSGRSKQVGYRQQEPDQHAEHGGVNWVPDPCEEARRHKVGRLARVHADAPCRSHLKLCNQSEENPKRHEREAGGTRPRGQRGRRDLPSAEGLRQRGEERGESAREQQKAPHSRARKERAREAAKPVISRSPELKPRAPAEGEEREQHVHGKGY